MLDICTSEVGDIAMSFNVKKSVAMRCGTRCRRVCVDLVLDGFVLKYVDDFKYLGVYVKKGKYFNCSFDRQRFKFYRSFNAIYSKSKTANSELITMFLLRSICLPDLLYAIEAVGPCKSALRTLDSVVDNAIKKTFTVSDNENVKIIRGMVGLKDAHCLYISRMCQLVGKLLNRPSRLAGVIGELAYLEVKPVLATHDISLMLSKQDQLRVLSRRVINSV